MKPIKIGLLVVLTATAAFTQQQTPDCQDVVFAIGYPRDSPSFAQRTLVAHARDNGTLNRIPAPLTLAEAVAKEYPGILIPEFEQDGRRLPGEDQVWSVTGKIIAPCVVNERGFGAAGFQICDGQNRNCMCVSMSPPECVGDSQFGPQMLALWQRNLQDEFKVGQFYTFTGPGFWCCENRPTFSLKPLFDITPAEAPGPGEEEPTPVNPPDVQISIPPIIRTQPVVVGNSETTEFEISTVPVNASFNGPVTLTVWTNALETDNFTVTVNPNVIPAPGRGTAEVQIITSPLTFPRDYLVTLSATANGKTFNQVFTVSVRCDPPAILGINQPRDATVNPGVRATFEVASAGTGPFTYQWYRGRRGSTTFPIANSNSNRLEVTGVDDLNLYWVRVSNACGTVDSTTVSIAPSRLRGIRR